MVFGHYIQFSFEIYLLLLFGSLSEIYYLKKSSNLVKSSSKIWAFIIFSFWVLMLIFSFLYWLFSKLKNKNEGNLRKTKKKRKKCKLWISGTKNSKLARSFTFLFLARRLLLCTLVFYFFDWNLNIKLWIYTIIQLTYIILLTLIRHLKKKKDLLLEWINNIFYLCLILILCIYNKQEEWNVLITDIFIYLIIANNFFTVFINICNSHILYTNRWYVNKEN